MQLRSLARVLQSSALLAALLLQACGGGGSSGGGGGTVAPVAALAYTKYCLGGDVVDAGGNCSQTTLLGAANVWTCTRDNATGLMWGSRNEVFNSSTSAPPSGTVCGVSGWRAPVVHELLSLTLPGKATGPQIDTAYFPGTPAAAFMSGETYLPDPSRSWAVGFDVGGGANVFGSGTAYVRWVAGSSRLSDPAESELVLRSFYLDHDVLDDTARGLAWLIPRNPQAMTYAQAVAAVATFNARDLGLGYRNWRLPTREELDTLVVRSLKLPAIRPKVLQRSSAALFTNVFWSSTALASFPDSVFGVSFEYGDVGPVLKSGQYGVVYVSDY